jgi:hypothetical protein
VLAATSSSIIYPLSSILVLFQTNPSNNWHLWFSIVCLNEIHYCLTFSLFICKNLYKLIPNHLW